MSKDDYIVWDFSLPGMVPWFLKPERLALYIWPTWSVSSLQNDCRRETDQVGY